MKTHVSDISINAANRAHKHREHQWQYSLCSYANCPVAFAFEWFWKSWKILLCDQTARGSCWPQKHTHGCDTSATCQNPSSPPVLARLRVSVWITAGVLAPAMRKQPHPARPPLGVLWPLTCEVHNDHSGLTHRGTWYTSPGREGHWATSTVGYSPLLLLLLWWPHCKHHCALRCYHCRVEL